MLTTRPDPSRYPDFLSSTRPVPSRSQKPLPVRPWWPSIFRDNNWKLQLGVGLLCLSSPHTCVGKIYHLRHQGTYLQYRRMFIHITSKIKRWGFHLCGWELKRAWFGFLNWFKHPHSFKSIFLFTGVSLVSVHVWLAWIGPLYLRYSNCHCLYCR